MAAALSNRSAFASFRFGQPLSEHAAPEGRLIDHFRVV